jgi:predicted metal-dependent peptidase
MLDPDLQANTERAVSATLLRMCGRSPFFATLALHAKIKITDDMPTAATDGRDVFVNPDFFNGLSAPAQEGLLLHEVLHAALLHVTRRGARDPKLWNIAADIVVNGMLMRDGYVIPDGGIRDVSKEHLATEEVYDLLLRDADKKPAPTLGMADLLDGTNGQGQPLDKAEIEGQWQQALQQALQQAKLVAEGSMQGDMPAGLRRELNALDHAQMDWRALLWRFLVQTPTDFAAFDRRFVGDGLYLETISGESVHVHACVDTSGSINKDDVTRFLSEVQAILGAYPHLRCDLYFADAALHGPHLLTAHALLPTPIGGGGTDFRPFFEHLDKHVEPHAITVAIYLTDGYGDFPAHPPALPTLWVVTPGGKDVDQFPFGEVVRLVEG